MFPSFLSRDLRTPDRVPALWPASPRPRPRSLRLSGVIPSDVLFLRHGAALLLREGVPALQLKVFGDAAAARRAGRGRAWPASRPASRTAFREAQVEFTPEIEIQGDMSGRVLYYSVDINFGSSPGLIGQ